jgi:D-glycero-D-manno-heptose 1,7-bisphosphate phosphatase
MFRQLERELGCSVAGSVFIGDRLSDIEAADAVGARAVLVRTGTGALTEHTLGERRIEVFDDLRAAVHALLSEAR